jgi:hypothetical protein
MASLNVISFFHASNMLEAAHKPVVMASLQGVQKTPCVMDIVDRLESSESLLGDRFEAHVLSSGPGSQQVFAISADQTPEQIDSPFTTNGPTMGALSSDRLAEHIVSHWKEGAHNVVHVRAHGHAHQDVMGMPTADFVAGIRKAGERLGHPLQTLLLESCLMANLEVMSGLMGSVQAVVASQEVLNAKALPHQEMFAQALEGPMDSKEVARRMVHSASTSGFPDTLIALDVEKLGAVSEAVASLKEQVITAQPGDKKKAMKSSLHFPRRAVETHLRKKLDVRDLGEVAQSFQTGQFGEQVNRQAEEVTQALEEATLALSLGPGYESLSGLSVRSDSIYKASGWNLLGIFGG